MLPYLDNVEKTKTWPVPTCVTDVQAILGMGDLLPAIHQRLLKKMQPPIQLTKKDKSFDWTTECQKSFDQLKEVVTGTYIIA